MKCQISYQFNLDEPGEKDYMESVLSYQKNESKLDALYDLFRQIIKYNNFPIEFQKCSEQEKEILVRFAERIRTFLSERDGD